MPNFRLLFDLDPGLIYLNAGTFGISPRSVTEAVSQYQKEFEKNPTCALISTWQRLWEVQTDLAAFFKADPEDLFLRPNVTEAINAFVFGMKLPAGSEIAISDLEYGAVVNICKLKAQRDGCNLKTICLAPNPGSESELLKSIVSGLQPNTSMFVISHVVTSTGLKVPLKALAKETKKRGILLVVDGAHGPGTTPLDFSELEDVDFYGGNLHKWMLGPKGTAFGWVNKKHHETLLSLQGGWTTFETPPQFSAFGNGNRFTARYLMAACHSFAPFFAIKDTLAFWRGHSETAIRNRLYALQSCLEDKMSALADWPLISAADSSLRGVQLCFKVPKKLETSGFQLMDRLLREHGLQVVTSLNKSGQTTIRISPHIYNTEDEIVRCVKILRAF